MHSRDAPGRMRSATDWPPLPIFVINLDRSVARLRKMEAQLGGGGGSRGGGGGGGGWKRVSAVYGDNVYGGSCVRTRSCAADTMSQGTPRLHPRSAAVAFSHMRAWREVEAPPT